MVVKVSCVFASPQLTVGCGGALFCLGPHGGMSFSTDPSIRVTSRPWIKDEYLKSTVDVLVLGKGSVCMNIGHSEVFKHIFARRVRQITYELKNHPTWRSSASVRNLRACKVRHESCTKPMGRFILYLSAVLQTLVEVWRTKTRLGPKYFQSPTFFSSPSPYPTSPGPIIFAFAPPQEFLPFRPRPALPSPSKENTHAQVVSGPPRSGKRDGRDALEHLEFIDNQRIVCLAMLADAGDESLMLARFYDTGAHDPGSAVEQHEQFRMRIDFLFVQGNCRDFGFTRHALTILESVYTIPLLNCTKTIGGGVSAADFDACLQRMRAWVFMATLTIQAEFPRYDVTHCCSIFRLDDSNDRQALDGRGRWVCIMRFAQVLKLDAQRLQAQIDMVYPFAAGLKSHSKGMSTMDAWRQAVTRLSADKTKRFYGKVNTLRKALLRACAWQGSTTSGVEQFFSRVDP